MILSKYREDFVMNGNNLLIDTNIIIGFLKGLEPYVSFLRSIDTSASISQITKMELLGFYHLTTTEEETILEIIAEMNVIELNSIIEKQVILLKRNKQMKLPDAIIAATAMSQNLTLVTADKALINSLKSIKLNILDLTQN